MEFGKIKAFFFDVDGVMTDGKVLVTTEGEQLRTFSIKDGWAINHAVKMGYDVVIISKGNNEGVRKRLEYLGVKEINLAVKDKVEVFEKYIAKGKYTYEDILYMGDDMPDYELLKLVGYPTCPADAVSDIKKICTYVSSFNGGDGAVRDVLEKAMKAQKKWPI